MADEHSELRDRAKRLDEMLPLYSNQQMAQVWELRQLVPGLLEQLEASRKDASRLRGLIAAGLDREQALQEQNEFHKGEVALLSEMIDGLKEQLQTAQDEAANWRHEYDQACKSLSKRVHQGAEAVRRERSLKEQKEATDRLLSECIEIMSLIVSKDVPEQADWDDINSWLERASNPASDPLGLEQADADFAAGKARPASEVFAEIEAEQNQESREG